MLSKVQPHFSMDLYPSIHPSMNDIFLKNNIVEHQEAFLVTVFSTQMFCHIITQKVLNLNSMIDVCCYNSVLIRSEVMCFTVLKFFTITWTNLAKFILPKQICISASTYKGELSALVFLWILQKLLTLTCFATTLSHTL